MPRDGLHTPTVALLAGTLWVLPGVVCAEVTSVSPFASSTFERTVHGNRRAIDLSRFGEAEAFAGVDALSTGEQQYLSSGLKWRSARGAAPLLQASALQTEPQNAGADSGQTLVRVENRLDLGGAWYLPDLSTEFAQVHDSTVDGRVAVGRAARVGLAHAVAGGDMTLSYFQADPQFDALGSAAVAGDRGAQLQTRLPVAGGNWQMAHDIRVHGSALAAQGPNLAQRFVLKQASTLTDIGKPWQFTAQLGGSPRNQTGDAVPLSLELASRTLAWSDWRVDSSLGWYRQTPNTPLDARIDGGLWRLSARRGLRIGGLQAELSPSFAIGGSADPRYPNVTRAGLNLGLSQISDRLDFSVNYMSAGWQGNPQNDDDIQMTVSFSQSTGALMPGLRRIGRHLRLPWQPRY